MPYDAKNRVLWGEDSIFFRSYSRRVFREWLEAKINAVQGQYRDALKLTDGRETVVTDVREIAKAVFQQKSAPPVVMVLQGQAIGTESGRTIDGERYNGANFSVTLNLDMGINETLRPDPQREYEDDSRLADAVLHAVRTGAGELAKFGLFNAVIEADQERARAGDGRHPHIVTFDLSVLDGFQPEQIA